MSGQGNQSQEQARSSCIDINIKYTFTLAITLIVGFLIFFAAMIAWDFVNASCKECEKFQGIQTLTATLGPIIAGIVGFYFGQKPTQELAKQNQEISTEKDKYKNEVLDSYKVIEKDATDLKNFKNELEQIKNAAERA